jgi:hypothetical protein
VFEAERPARIRVLIDRNADCFPGEIGRWLRAEPRISSDAVSKVVAENEGDIPARRLVDFDEEARQLVVCAGSLTARGADGRGDTVDLLQSPLVLAWRVWEDLQDALIAAIDLTADPVVERALRKVPDSIGRLDAFVGEALDRNPQFYPPPLLERLNLGVSVLSQPPHGEAIYGMFHEDEMGSGITLYFATLDTSEWFDNGLTARSFVIETLNHEMEHLMGNMKGFDPLGARENAGWNPFTDLG